MSDNPEALIFRAKTPIGFSVRVTRSPWDVITTLKHPIMAGRENDIKEVLEQPDEIRRSKRDTAVYLFYRLQYPGRWVCAVAKKVDTEGFLITAYPTDAIKEGDRVWPR